MARPGWQEIDGAATAWFDARSMGPRSPGAGLGESAGTADWQAMFGAITSLPPHVAGTAA